MKTDDIQPYSTVRCSRWGDLSDVLKVMFQLFCHLRNDPTLNPSNLSPKRGRVPRGRSLIFNTGSFFFFVPTGDVIARTSPNKKRPTIGFLMRYSCSA